MNLKNNIDKIYRMILHPIKDEFPFFILFLFGIMVIPLRLFIADLHYGSINEIFNFVFSYLPRAVVWSYIFTLAISFTKRKFLKCCSYTFASLLLAVTVFLNLVFNKTLQPDIITLIAETNTEETSEFLTSFLFSKGGIITIVLTLLYICATVCAEKNKVWIITQIKKIRYKVLLKIVILLFSVLCLFSLNFYYVIFNVKDIDILPSHDGRDDAITSLVYSLYSIRLVNEEMKHAVQVTRDAKPGYIDENDSLNVVYVIGESYIKSHSQLYGYQLPTTPNLCVEEKKGTLCGDKSTNEC